MPVRVSIVPKGTSIGGSGKGKRRRKPASSSASGSGGGSSSSPRPPKKKNDLNLNAVRKAALKSGASKSEVSSALKSVRAGYRENDRKSYSTSPFKPLVKKGYAAAAKKTRKASKPSGTHRPPK